MVGIDSIGAMAADVAIGFNIGSQIAGYNIINKYTCGWISIDLWDRGSALHDRDRVVFKTKNEKLFVTKRFVDEWLINKYMLTHFIILPE